MVWKKWHQGIILHLHCSERNRRSRSRQHWCVVRVALRKNVRREELDKSGEPVEQKWTFFLAFEKYLTQLVQDFNSKIEALNYTNNVVSLNGGLAGQTWRKSPISPSSFQSNEYSHGISTFHHQALLESFKQRLGEGQSGEKVDTEFRCLLEKSDAERWDFWLKIHDRWS